MNYSVECVPKNKWLLEFHSELFESSFGEKRPMSLEKCSYALVVKKDDMPSGFVTCIEMDSETLYWQWGGASKEKQGSIDVVNMYLHLLQWSAERFKRVTTRIENTNIKMLRLAMKCGFLIQGVWNFKGHCFLELCREFE